MVDVHIQKSVKHSNVQILSMVLLMRLVKGNNLIVFLMEINVFQLMYVPIMQWNILAIMVDWMEIVFGKGLLVQKLHSVQMLIMIRKLAWNLKISAVGIQTL